MRVIEEIRRERLQILLQERGSYVALNTLLGLNARDATLSQIANAAPNSATGKERAMGSALARRIEAAASKPRGWMDNDQRADVEWPLPQVDRARWERLTAEDQAYVQSVMNLAISQRENTALAPSGGAVHTGHAPAPEAPVLHEPAQRAFGT